MRSKSPLLLVVLFIVNQLQESHGFSSTRAVVPHVLASKARRPSFQCKSRTHLSGSTQDFEVTSIPADQGASFDRWWEREMGPKDKVPAPLDEIIDLDLSLRTAIYECTLGRELGID